MFSGYGGLDLAAEVLVGGTTAWHAEIEPAACRVLEEHWPGVPNLGDVAQLDWVAVTPVDVLTAGFPCQDLSYAGKGAGIREGTRSGLWSAVVAAVRGLRPGLLLLENVGAIVSRRPGLDLVLADLAGLGFDAEWTCLRASDVGACHRRERWFLAAWPAPELAGGDGSSGHALLPTPLTTTATGVQTLERRVGGRGALLPTPSAADALGGHVSRSGDRRGELLLPGLVKTFLPTPAAGVFNDGESVESWTERRDRLKEKHGNGNGMGTPLSMAVKMLPTPRSTDGPKGGPGQVNGRGVADSLPAIEALLPTPVTDPSSANGHARNLGSEARWGDYTPAIARHEAAVGRLAPPPTEPGRKGPRLSPRFVEWMQMLPQGWVTEVEGLTRNAQLKMLGNGVVPPQAFTAFAHLLDRIEVGACA